MTANMLTRYLTPQNIGLISIGFIFLVCSLYFQPNLGGEGLALPYNIATWTGASILITLSIFYALRNGTFVYSRFWPGLILFPLSIIISGYIVDTLIPTEWFFRQLFILAGIVYLFSLFQFRWTNLDTNKLLYILVMAGFIQAMYGMIQVIWPSADSKYIALSTDNQPFGIFQQVNLQASFQATILIVNLYAISRPAFIKQPALIKALFFISLFTSSFLISVTGSRVGILSAFISILLFIIGRFQIIKKQKITFIVAAFAISLGAYQGKDGILTSYKKLTDLTQVVSVHGAANRIHIYSISLGLALERPFVGHGIGSFQNKFQAEKIEYLRNTPNATLPPLRLSHPHNELLFWLVEGGVIALTGILIATATVLYAAFCCGWRRGLTYLATLFPIGFHCQVELPFYISSLHWILFLTLLFLILQHSRWLKSINLSLAATLSIKAVALIIFLWTVTFMYQANKANATIVSFLNDKMRQPLLLQPVLDNAYFRETGELYLMRTLMLRSYATQNYEFLPEFITWAEEYIHIRPIPQLFVDLSQAYRIVGDKEKGEAIFARGKAMYPDNQATISADKFFASQAASTAIQTKESKD